MGRGGDDTVEPGEAQLGGDRTGVEAGRDNGGLNDLGSSFSEDHGRMEKKQLPNVDDASWISKLLFFWFFPVLRVGYKQVLGFAQLSTVSKHDDPEMLYGRFNELWRLEQERAEEAGVQPSLIKVSGRVVGYSVIARGFLLTCVQYGTMTAIPFAAKTLIESLTPEAGVSHSEQVLAAVMTVILPLLSSFAYSQAQYISKRGSMHLFTVFTQAIFQKSLRLSSASRNQSSSGQIVNLMATDAGTTLERAIAMIYPLFIAPPLLGVLLYLVYLEIGASAYAGLVVIVVATPINLKIFMSLSKFYGKVIGRTDERLKLINEAMQAIRVLKMYAWEVPFMKKITEMREQELGYLQKHAYVYSVGLNSVFLNLPFIVQFSAFAVYHLTGNIFYPATIFTAIQLFQKLQTALTQLPSSISQMSQTVVAMRRIQKFLLLPELQLDDGDVMDLTDADVARAGSIEIVGASFAWNLGDHEKQAGPSLADLTMSAGALPAGAKGGAGKRQHETEESANQKKDKRSKKKGKKTDSGETEKGTPTDLEAPSPPKPPTLRDISLQLRPGQRCAIVGRVGQGKSSILAAMMGELYKRSGSLALHGSVAFAPQQPWIVSQSLRDNILFGKPMERERYNAVIKACCIEPDLVQLKDGDRTEIGERGINLSGGQRARISLARCVYADTSIVLLDDVLSAVDAHVGAAIFENCIMGPLLKDKTVVWVTNKVDRLAEVDHILVVQDGTIIDQGSFSELQSHFDLAHLLDEEDKVDEEEKTDDADNDKVAEGEDQDGGENKGEEVTPAAAGGGDQEEGRGEELYSEEREAVGTLKLSVLTFYIRSMGVPLFFLAYGLYVIYLFSPLFAGYVLAFWSDETVCDAPGSTCRTDKGADFWFAMYATILFGGFVICGFAGIFIAWARVAGSRSLHNDLLESTFRAGITDFFDITPMGRILNRFSKDVSMVDVQLSQMFMFAVVTIVYSLAAFVGIVLGTDDFFVLLMVPVMAMYLLLYGYVRTTSIKLQRLEASARSPIYSGFAEVLNGLGTVRAFNQQERFMLLTRSNVELNIRAFFLVRVVLPSWLLLMVNFLGCLITGSVCAYVLLSDGADPGFAALSLTYASQITETLNAACFIGIEVETQIQAVERIKLFVDHNEPEEPARDPDNLLLDDEETKEPFDPLWPQHGLVEFRGVRAGYRQGPDVIKSLSLTIQAGERVGICGRTGSGKSSALGLLLNIIRPREGEVLIDGINLNQISLKTLRSRIAIIPQEPVCFMGSIRFNLDPFSQYGDEELRECLRAVHLHQFVDDLGFEVAEGGANISAGQSQMLAFGRALMRKTRLVLLDEATASVDKQTDQLLQTLIRQEFANRTTITIAHRLDTILESTRVLVLAAGEVVEFDAPQALLANPNSAFAGMVQAETSSSASSRPMTQ